MKNVEKSSSAGTKVDSEQVFKTRRSAKPIAKPNVMRSPYLADELSHEEIARVFALYVGCDLQCPKSQNPETNGIIKMGHYPDDIYWTANEYQYCKLLLKPLLSISDEDALDIGNSYFSDFNKIIAKVERSHGMTFLKYHSASVCLTSVDVQHYNIYMRLIQLGYAVPLFIAPNHLSNGKTAIELGLANDVTIINAVSKGDA